MHPQQQQRQSLDDANLMSMQGAGAAGGRPPLGDASDAQQSPVEGGGGLASGYAEPMRDLLRFLDAVSATRPGADFRAEWAEMGSPSTVGEVNHCLARMKALPPQHLLQTMRTMDAPTRAYFHAQAIKLSHLLKSDMTELVQAVMVLHWVLRVLPHLSSLPEEGALGTSSEVKRNFAAVDSACKVCRPDERNPVCLNLAAACDASKQTIDSLAQRLTAAGVDPASDPAGDAAALKAAAAVACKPAQTQAIVGFVLFGVAVVGIVAILVTCLLKKKKLQGGGAGEGGTGKPGLGAGAGGAASQGFPAEATGWGFPAVAEVLPPAFGSGFGAGAGAGTGAPSCSGR